jgi:fructokinase
MTMTQAWTLGELLIDFVSTQTGVSVGQAPAFEKAPGGAPANVAVGLARLGIASGFLGKVGDDEFGHFLAHTLEQNGVDVSGLRYSDRARTMLAFVSLTADGERDFMFYRHPSADMLLHPDDIDRQAIGAARLLHHGSISLISEPSRSATLAAIAAAHEQGLWVSYDPNLRLNLWPSTEAARQGLLSAWHSADVIKVSRDELAFLSGEKDWIRGAETLWHDRLRLLVITAGPQGCHYVTRGARGDHARGHVPTYDVPVVDTTGAGDGFVAGLLAGLLENESAWDDVDALQDVLRLANAVGALTTTQRGAIPALPSRERVSALLEQR